MGGPFRETDAPRQCVGLLDQTPQAILLGYEVIHVGAGKGCGERFGGMCGFFVRQGGVDAFHQDD
ncbi:MAG: hypothetical protein LUG50_13185 [Planctomycetaceae bacterium]|nr:hypothetical protein [Planctomycetaceae bacterium]